MKYTLLFIIHFIYACNSAPVSNKSESKKIDTVQVVEINKCILKSDAFTFKNISLGMDVSELKNIKKIKSDFYSLNENIERQCGITTYMVKNVSDYTIFEKKISEMELSFLNKKLFDIRIQLRDNIISDLAKKFEATNCAENLNEPEKLPSLTLSNDKFMLYYRGLYPILIEKNSKTDYITYYLDITDVKAYEIIDYCIKKKNEEINNKRVQDF